jgi:hypothetical protein
MMTRRDFMSSLAFVGGAAGLGLSLDILRRRQLGILEIVPASVLPLQGAVVTIRDQTGRTLSAVVERVNAVSHPARPGAPGTEQISLLLKTQARDLSDGAYRIQTDELNFTELDFTAVDQPGSGQRLEAVISRIV